MCERLGIQPKSHKDAYTYTVTKREKGKKYIYLYIKKGREQQNQWTNLPMIINSKYKSKINIKPETSQSHTANPKSTVAPKVHHLNLGWFVVYSGISQMQGTSSWLWTFNPLLLRLLGEISLSLLCSNSSWGSALDLASPLCVGHLRASVPAQTGWG